MVAFKPPDNRPRQENKLAPKPLYDVGMRMAEIIWRHAELGEIVLSWPWISDEKKKLILEVLRKQQKG